MGSAIHKFLDALQWGGLDVLLLSQGAMSSVVPLVSRKYIALMEQIEYLR